jgi:hypothetical protein
VQSLVGKDLSANFVGTTESFASDWSSLDAFFEHDVSGKHCWINCSTVGHLKRYIEHFLECRRKDPSRTSACLLLPHMHALDWQLLKGWKLVLNLPKGSVIRKANDLGEFVEQRSARMMQVLYYAPSPSVLKSLGDVSNSEKEQHLDLSVSSKVPRPVMVCQMVSLWMLILSCRLPRFANPVA